MNWTERLIHMLSDWLEDAQGEWEELTAPEPEPTPVPWAAFLVAGAAVVGVLYVARSRQAELKGLAIERLVEGPAEGQSFSALRGELETRGEALAGRAQAAADTEANRETLRHIIGMERWGRARLQSAVLHRPWVMDEYHDYKPPRDKTLAELTEIFVQQRARTVALAQQLHEDPPRLGDKVPHNEHGPLSVRGWLRYLRLHAELEARRLR